MIRKLGNKFFYKHIIFFNILYNSFEKFEFGFFKEIYSEGLDRKIYYIKAEVVIMMSF